MSIRLLPLDNNGIPFRFQPANIDWREREKIRHEINTNYDKYRNQLFCVHPSFGLDYNSYNYYFENHGFDNINIYDRQPNLY